MELFGFAAIEKIALILAVTMLVFGPERAPAMAREAGKWYRLARRYSDNVMKDVRSTVAELDSELKDQLADVKGQTDEGLRAVRELGTHISATSGPEGQDSMKG